MCWSCTSGAMSTMPWSTRATTWPRRRLPPRPRGSAPREPGGVALHAPRRVGRLELLQALIGQAEAKLAMLERRSAYWYSMLPRALRCRGNPARPLASHLALAAARHAAAQGQSPDRLEV